MENEPNFYIAPDIKQAFMKYVVLPIVALASLGGTEGEMYSSIPPTYTVSAKHVRTDEDSSHNKAMHYFAVDDSTQIAIKGNFGYQGPFASDMMYTAKNAYRPNAFVFSSEQHIVPGKVNKISLEDIASLNNYSFDRNNY